MMFGLENTGPNTHGSLVQKHTYRCQVWFSDRIGGEPFRRQLLLGGREWPVRASHHGKCGTEERARPKVRCVGTSQHQAHCASGEQAGSVPENAECRGGASGWPKQRSHRSQPLAPPRDAPGSMRYDTACPHLSTLISALERTGAPWQPWSYLEATTGISNPQAANARSRALGRAPPGRGQAVTQAVPVVDLFSGPGGLAEGFAACRDKRARPRFEVALSVEMEAWAYKTLRMRAFLRKFGHDCLPEY